MALNCRHRPIIAVGTILIFMTTVHFAALAAADKTAQISWRLPRDHLPEIRDELRLRDGTFTPDEASQDDTKGLPLIYVVAGIVALPSLVSAISTAVRDVWCGGAVVQEKDGELIISCEPALGTGTVVVRDKNGVKVQHFDDVKDPSSLLEALGKLRAVK
ncbi:MAG: hypothetical protein ACR2QJ_11435 [Geminicoccaceae bacterium]